MEKRIVAANLFWLILLPMLCARGMAFFSLPLTRGLPLACHRGSARLTGMQFAYDSTRLR